VVSSALIKEIQTCLQSFMSTPTAFSNTGMVQQANYDFFHLSLPKGSY